MNDSPIILAVDTTSEFGSVALRRAHQTVAEIGMNVSDGWGHLIIQMIRDVLTKVDMPLDRIDCFAAASGPGSFTGVRVGLSVIKGLAEAMHKPATGISNLRALSLAGKAPLRAVVLDARREQIYCALYDAHTRLVAEETVSTWEAWVKHVPPGAEFIGLPGGPCQTAQVSFTQSPKYLAASIAACADIDGPAGWADPVALDANYVRRSDAELFWKDS